jgi:hypothetical protein
MGLWMHGNFGLLGGVKHWGFQSHERASQHDHFQHFT